MKKRLVVVGVLAATLSVLRAGADAQYEWAANLPGCDPARPAVAHHADQQVLAEQPTDGPVPCGMLHGWPSVETRIEVTSKAVIQEPALPAPLLAAGGVDAPGGMRRNNAMARSFDEGRTWDVVSVELLPDTYVTGSAGVDNNLYVDHDTDRLFAYLYGGENGGPGRCGAGKGATVAFSDDHGTTWNWGFDLDHNCSENPTILAGKPTVSDPSQMGYPNVVYLCGTSGITNTGIGGVGNQGRSCSKSLDGGRSWLSTLPRVQGASLQSFQGCYAGQCKDSSNPYSECGGATSSSSAGVQPLPDGGLLVIVSCGDNTYLSQSDDEGATWNIVRPIPHGGTLRADSQGNLYKLIGTLLSVSIDEGETWSPELDMLAPGVALRNPSFFAQGTHRDGHEPAAWR